jgi:hypothetical protein
LRRAARVDLTGLQAAEQRSAIEDVEFERFILRSPQVLVPEAEAAQAVAPPEA